ncbi:DUF1573 domain-containing protein [Candidatus Gottesmanbacteria bacterium]|nr:DUF1573 domain-containing protein [Candidatus Gottesmanbacteria bacterium]
MAADTKIILGAIVVSLALIIGAVVVLGKDNSPKREAQGTASMTIDKKSEDFGSMKVTDERTANFTITNTGDSVLRIWNVVTSCDCAFASVVINDRETGEFSMHRGGQLGNWIGEIPAKQTALLKVTYRPKVMPVQGPVSRQVTFATNDPNNSEVQVSVSANVL